MTSQTITVPLINDGAGNDAFSVVLSSPTGGASLGSPATATVNIGSNPNGMFEFSPSTYSVDETGGSVILTVTRSAGTNGAVTVDYTTSDGTALSGTNYDATSGTLTFNAGEASKTITVSVTSDGSNNGDKAFTVALSNPTGGADLSANPMATVVVKDVSTGPVIPDVISLASSDYSVDETSPSVLITVTRSLNTTGTVTVDYATSDGTAHVGTNYLATSGTLTFIDGQTSATISVPIKDDGVLLSFDKYFQLTISNPTGGAQTLPPTSATITVKNVPQSDRGQFVFDDDYYKVIETQPSINLTINRKYGSKGVASVDCTLYQYNRGQWRELPGDHC